MVLNTHTSCKAAFHRNCTQVGCAVELKDLKGVSAAHWWDLQQQSFAEMRSAWLSLQVATHRQR